MLNIYQLCAAVADVRSGTMSIDAFERWMRRASLNVHRWGDEDLIETILSVEAVLSEYHFAGMEESAVREEMANVVRPFEVAPPSFRSAPYPIVIDVPQQIEMRLGVAVLRRPMGRAIDALAIGSREDLEAAYE